METIIRNASLPIPECDATNPAIKAAINNRILDNIDISVIKAEIKDLHDTVVASSDPKIQTINNAITFPINDILQMIIDHPGCKFIRVYNGFDSNGKFVNYLVPLNDNLKVYDNCKKSVPCCQCRPCIIG
jgi:hypothetical protein